METSEIRALAIQVLHRNSRGNQTETRGFSEKKSSGNNFQVSMSIGGNSETTDCFDPEGILEAVIRKVQTNEEVLKTIDDLIQTECLKASWGFMVKDSPLIGNYWIISDTSARERIPVGATSFTIEELRPIVETCRVFEGAKVINVVKLKTKEVLNAAVMGLDKRDNL